jgi:hypothetical protein
MRTIRESKTPCFVAYWIVAGIALGMLCGILVLVLGIFL